MIYDFIAMIGITGILLYGKILDPILWQLREDFHLFKCPMCLGFWVGFVFCLFFKENTSYNIVIYSFGNSAVAYAFWQIFPYVEELKHRLGNE